MRWCISVRLLVAAAAVLTALCTSATLQLPTTFVFYIGPEEDVDAWSLCDVQILQRSKEDPWIQVATVAAEAVNTLTGLTSGLEYLLRLQCPPDTAQVRPTFIAFNATTSSGAPMKLLPVGTFTVTRIMDLAAHVHALDVNGHVPCVTCVGSSHEALPHQHQHQHQHTRQPAATPPSDAATTAADISSYISTKSMLLTIGVTLALMLGVVAIRKRGNGHVGKEARVGTTAAVKAMAPPTPAAAPAVGKGGGTTNVSVHAPASVIVNLTLPGASSAAGVAAVGAGSLRAGASSTAGRASAPVSSVLAKSPFGPTVKRKAAAVPILEATASLPTSKDVPAGPPAPPAVAPPATPAPAPTVSATIDQAAAATSSEDPTSTEPPPITTTDQKPAEDGAELLPLHDAEHTYAVRFLASSRSLQAPATPRPCPAGSSNTPAEVVVFKTGGNDVEFAVTNTALWKHAHRPALVTPPKMAAAAATSDGEGEPDVHSADLDDSARLMLHTWNAGSGQVSAADHKLPLASRIKRKAALHRIKEAARAKAAATPATTVAPVQEVAAQDQTPAMVSVQPTLPIVKRAPPPPPAVPAPTPPAVHTPVKTVTEAAAPELQTPQPEAAAADYSKYVRMLRMGVPLPAVEQKMRSEGADVDEAEWRKAAITAASGASVLPVESAEQTGAVPVERPVIQLVSPLSALTLPVLPTRPPPPVPVATPAPAPAPAPVSAHVEPNLSSAIENLLAGRMSPAALSSPLPRSPSVRNVLFPLSTNTPTAASPGARKQRVSLVDGRRAQNVAIALSRLKAFSNTALSAAIHELRDQLPTKTQQAARLTAAQLQLLVEQMPTPTEAQAVSSWAASHPDEVDNLGEAEAFFLAMAAVPQAAARASALLFRATAAEKLQAAATNIRMLGSATAELRSCSRVRMLLSTSRALAGKLGPGTEFATKLTLSTLPQFAAWRVPGAGRDAKGTGAHFIAALLSQTHGSNASNEVVAAQRELAAVASVGRLDVAGLTAELQALKTSAASAAALAKLPASATADGCDFAAVLEVLGDPNHSVTACAPALLQATQWLKAKLDAALQEWRTAMTELCTPMSPAPADMRPDAAAAAVMEFLGALAKATA